MIEVTSSRTPSIAENSWRAPSTSIAYIDAPGREDNKTLLIEFPSVIPKPLSKGAITNLPYLLVSSYGSTISEIGFSNFRTFSPPYIFVAITVIYH